MYMSTYVKITCVCDGEGSGGQTDRCQEWGESSTTSGRSSTCLASSSTPTTVVASADRAGRAQGVTEVRDRKSRQLPSCDHPRGFWWCGEPPQSPQAPREQCWLTGAGWQVLESQGSRCTALPAPPQVPGYLRQPSGWVPTAQHRICESMDFILKVRWRFICQWSLKTNTFKHKSK